MSYFLVRLEDSIPVRLVPKASDGHVCNLEAMHHYLEGSVEGIAPLHGYRSSSGYQVALFCISVERRKQYLDDH